MMESVKRVVGECSDSMVVDEYRKHKVQMYASAKALHKIVHNELKETINVNVLSTTRMGLIKQAVKDLDLLMGISKSIEKLT